MPIHLIFHYMTLSLLNVTVAVDTQYPGADAKVELSEACLGGRRS